jgi:hypothetical protein
LIGLVVNDEAAEPSNIRCLKVLNQFREQPSVFCGDDRARPTLDPFDERGPILEICLP